MWGRVSECIVSAYKYDLNQLFTEVDIFDFSSLSRIILWLTESKALLRSIKTVPVLGVHPNDV